VDGLTTRASLINFFTATAIQRRLQVYIRPRSSVAPSSPCRRLLEWLGGCALAPQKCAAVYGRAQKAFSFIVMISMQPCIETDRLSMRKRASGTVKVLS
jgi:hypothetical protein